MDRAKSCVAAALAAHARPRVSGALHALIDCCNAMQRSRKRRPACVSQPSNAPRELHIATPPAPGPCHPSTLAICCTFQPPASLPFSCPNAPKPNLSQSASFVFSKSFAFQQMSSPPQSPARASCPFQLSEHSIASFTLELPPLDESRLSPALAAISAQVRIRFMSAASDAQSLMHSMREAWMQWHLLPVIPQGELLVSVLLRHFRSTKNLRC